MGEEMFLPLGSVVLLKGASKKLMICGRLQKRHKDDQVYDYCACLWPEGVINSNEFYLFDHQDIETLWFEGLKNAEEEKLNERLKEEIEKHH